jgi:hypothetical protein
MKIFQCSNCDHPVFFENTYCESCGYSLGYSDTEDQIYAFNPKDSNWQIGDQIFRYCKNHDHGVCNWLITMEHDTCFCTACSLNRTIPDLSVSENYKRWKKLEIAKHRLVYSLLKLQLPLRSKLQFPDTGLCFDFLSAKVQDASGNTIMTGHADGVITIILAEADSVNREQIRKSLNEPYRTLIGHFRHEVGHYFWQILIYNNQELLESFRSLFGDERQHYTMSLTKHYQTGAPASWRENFISEYASSHPWEDWAETWAHYLHIVNAMETAYYFGLEGNPKLSNAPHMKIESFYPYEQMPFKTILDETVPLFYAVNSINRSMGIPDVYPFVISNEVKVKLEFIHQMLQALRDR